MCTRSILIQPNFYRILIVILEPAVLILEKIERPTITKEGSAPNISWGQGSIPG